MQSRAESDEPVVRYPIIEVDFIISLDDDLERLVILDRVLQVLHEGVVWLDLDLIALLLVEESDFLFVQFSVFVGHSQRLN